MYRIGRAHSRPDPPLAMPLNKGTIVQLWQFPLHSCAQQNNCCMTTTFLYNIILAWLLVLTTRNPALCTCIMLVLLSSPLDYSILGSSRLYKATMHNSVKLLLIVLLGTITLGVSRVYKTLQRSRPVQPQDQSQPVTVQPQDQSQPVQPQDQSQPVQPQDQSQPVQPQDQSQPVQSQDEIQGQDHSLQLQDQSQPQIQLQLVQPQDQSQPQDQYQPVNQHDERVITSGIPSQATQARQTPHAPHSGAASRSTGTHTLLLQNGLCMAHVKG